MLSPLALALAISPAQSRDVKLLPYLLGTAPRSPEWLARHNREDRKKFRQATCSFGVLGLLSNLGRLTFMLRNIVNSCPQSVEDSASYQPGEEATLPVKVCLLSVSALFGGLAQAARSLTVLVSTCARTATVEEGCAASIETLLVPVTLFINGGIAISAACDKGAVDLPKDIQPNRRLLDPRDLPVKRQWDIAQCTMDAIDAARAVAALGLTLDLLSRSCPVNRVTRFTEKITTAACTVDVSVLLTSFTRLVFYLALAVNHCSPEQERDAICLVGVSAVAAGMSTASAGGAGTYATCDMGKKRQRRERLVAAGKLKASDAGVAAPSVIASSPFQLVRRLVKPRRLEKAWDWHELEELWLKMGYNISDPTADWLIPHEGNDPQLRSAVEAAQLLRSNWTPPVHHLAPISTPTALQSGPREVACSIESADPLRLRSGVAGESVSVEDNATECQARCFRIPSCAEFAYWGPGGQCHILGFLEMPVQEQLLPSTAGWVSGPPSCDDAMGPALESPHPRALRQLMAKRYDACYASHTAFQPLLEDVEPRILASVLDCQHWCQQQPGCSFFSYFALSGLCHLSPADAQRLHPVLNFVAGPKSCEEAEFIAETTLETGGMHVGLPRALGQGTLAVAVSILSVLAMKFCKAQSIIFGSKFDSKEATVEPDDAVPLANAGA
eukprot:s2267_g5.t1